MPEKYGTSYYFEENYIPITSTFIAIRNVLWHGLDTKGLQPRRCTFLLLAGTLTPLSGGFFLAALSASCVFTVWRNVLISFPLPAGFVFGSLYKA
jgi:hypothetical protein